MRGVAGTLAHSALMYLKSRTGLLPEFQPYESFHIALAQLIGRDINPIMPWALSFLNCSTIVAFIFGRAYWLLPGNNGAIKGLIYGLFAWAMMGLLFLPLLGLGLFATHIGLGIAPALFALAMLVLAQASTCHVA